MFQSTDFKSLPINATDLIGQQWMLITAGSSNHFNSMTASWGGLGVLWKKEVTFIFVRPTRYTFDFCEKNDFFTLCFFEEKYRKELNFFGTHSGRDIDKVKETGFTPLETATGNIYYREAKLVLECRKLYYDDIKPGNFLAESIHKNYPLKDYHRLYIGEIIETFIKQGEV